MLQLLAYLTLLSGMMLICLLPIALLVQLATYSRRRVWTAQLSITLLMIFGFIAAGIGSWGAFAASWPLYFPTTLAATVDSETFGHPVEHAAENLVLAVLFFAIIGSAAAGAAGALTLKRR